MKATIDLPDELYRRVKAKSALEGRPVRAVAVELFLGYVESAPPTGAATRRSGRSRPEGSESRPAWFGLARKHMGKVADHGMDAVRESIARGWAREVAEKEAGLKRRLRR